jgi:hypothetical protein
MKGFSMVGCAVFLALLILAFVLQSDLKEYSRIATFIACMTLFVTVLFLVPLAGHLKETREKRP